MLLFERDVPDAADEHAVDRLAAPLTQSGLGPQEERVAGVRAGSGDAATAGVARAVNRQDHKVLYLGNWNNVTNNHINKRCHK